jgi:hypothetical protein
MAGKPFGVKVLALLGMISFVFSVIAGTMLFRMAGDAVSPDYEVYGPLLVLLGAAWMLSFLWLLKMKKNALYAVISVGTLLSVFQFFINALGLGTIFSAALAIVSIAYLWPRRGLFS